MVEWSNGQKIVKMLILLKYFEISAANKGLERWMTGPESLKASEIVTSDIATHVKIPFLQHF